MTQESKDSKGYYQKFKSSSRLASYIFIFVSKSSGWRNCPAFEKKQSIN
jgi:hypothetical protein